MTRSGDIIGDLPQQVVELCRRHLGIINTVTPLANARHVLFRLSGADGVGVLKIHGISPDLWLREHTANLLFEEHSQLLDAVPGYLLFKFVDAPTLVRRLIADTPSSPANLFVQSAARASEIHRASLALNSALLGNFPLFDANGCLSAVIDWELARIAPPLCDLATLLRFAPDDASESAVLHASTLGLSVDARSARYDLIRVSLSMSKPDLTGEDVPIWANFIDGCAVSLLENDPEPARAASRGLLTLP
jgi:hypothetical protein